MYHFFHLFIVFVVCSFRTWFLRMFNTTFDHFAFNSFSGDSPAGITAVAGTAGQAFCITTVGNSDYRLILSFVCITPGHIEAHVTAALATRRTIGPIVASTIAATARTPVPVFSAIAQLQSFLPTVTEPELAAEVSIVALWYTLDTTAVIAVGADYSNNHFVNTTDQKLASGTTWRLVACSASNHLLKLLSIWAWQPIVAIHTFKDIVPPYW